MSLRRSARFGLLVLALCTAFPATAQQLRFMTETPYTFFSNEDHKLFEAALTEALTKAADGEAKPWSNAASGAGGEVKPVKSFERKGQKCRTLSVANKAKGRSNSGEYNFCQQAKGRFGGWGLAN